MSKKKETTAQENQKKEQEKEKKEQEKCMICFENKATARLPCTCVANVCRDCWTTQRENSTSCIVCHKQLPIFLTWHFSGDSITLPLVMLLFMAAFGLCIYYLMSVTHYILGPYLLACQVATTTVMIVQDALVPKVVTAFFNGKDGIAIMAGVTLALVHLYLFLGGLDSAFGGFSWYFVFCSPALILIAFVFANQLLTMLGAFILAAGVRVDAVRASDFK